MWKMDTRIRLSQEESLASLELLWSAQNFLLTLGVYTGGPVYLIVSFVSAKVETLEIRS